MRYPRPTATVVALARCIGWYEHKRFDLTEIPRRDTTKMAQETAARNQRRRDKRENEGRRPCGNMIRANHKERIRLVRSDGFDAQQQKHP